MRISYVAITLVKQRGPSALNSRIVRIRDIDVLLSEL